MVDSAAPMLEPTRRPVTVHGDRRGSAREWGGLGDSDGVFPICGTQLRIQVKGSLQLGWWWFQVVPYSSMWSVEMVPKQQCRVRLRPSLSAAV